MKATIMYRNSYDGGDGWVYYPMPVEISDTCPVCGGPRGKPVGYSFHEDGESFTVDRWDNPCGHVDLYKDVYHEHLARIRSIELDNPMPRRVKARVGERGNGSFCLYFEDIGSGDTPVGQFTSIRDAVRIAELNGYDVVDSLIHQPCGGSNG